MILHITFSDGSNPWFSFKHERHDIAKQWRRWIKHHSTAQPQAWKGNYICARSTDNSRYDVWKCGEYVNTRRSYKHLGHALAALEKLGGVSA